MATGTSRAFRTIVDFDDNANDLSLALRNMTIRTQQDIANGGGVADRPDQESGDMSDVSSLSRSSYTATASTELSTTTDDNEYDSLDESWDWTLTNHDKERSHPQGISQEVERLQNVRTFDMIERDDDPTAKSTLATLKRLATMGARLLNVPICNVNIMDMGRAYIMAGVGIPDSIRESSRKETWCNHTMQYQQDHMVVPDATKDWRFCHSPHVTGPFQLRFYASTPLVSPEGYRLGTFCIMGMVARPLGLNEEETATFLDLGQLATQALISRRELLRSRQAMEAAVQVTQAATHDIKGLLDGIQYCLKKPMLHNSHKGNSVDHQQGQSDDHGSISAVALAADTVQDITEATLSAVQDEALKSNSSVVRSSKEKEMPREEIHLQTTLERLRKLMDPLPKGSPIAFTVDSGLPPSIFAASAQQLDRACLNLLRHALSHASGSRPIQFRIAPQEEQRQVIFECRYCANQESLEVLSTSGALGYEERAADEGVWPLSSHVRDLGGTFGSQQPQSGDAMGDGECSVWFTIPYLTSASSASDPPGVGRAKAQDVRDPGNATRTRKRRNNNDGSLEEAPIRPLIRSSSATRVSDSAASSSKHTSASQMESEESTTTNTSVSLLPPPGSHSSALLLDGKHKISPGGSNGEDAAALGNSRKRIKLNDSTGAAATMMKDADGSNSV